MSQTKLFEPYKLGPITLPNRLVMAPLTRNRAVPPGMVPSPLGGRLLRAARLRRTADHRGKPGFAAGPGLSGHARHLLEGTGRRLAQGHGPRA